MVGATGPMQFAVPVLQGAHPLTQDFTYPRQGRVLILMPSLQAGSGGQVTFLTQKEPVDERGRALFAVARSIIRAQLDQLTPEDLQDLDRDRADVTLRQLAKLSRLERDKGMRGDGFEWAIHEAIHGGEPTVTAPLAWLMGLTSRKAFGNVGQPKSLLFGYERAKYLGFLDAVIDEAGQEAVLLPDGRGRPFHFGPWVTVAARGAAAEPLLRERIRKVWKTDLFLSDESRHYNVAATIKSNWHLLEGGPGLRIGIVPEAPDLKPGTYHHKAKNLWLAVLKDPGGFMGLFNDAYAAVAEAVVTLGRHERGPYYYKPTPQAQRLQQQLEKYGTARVVEVEDALNEAAQQHLLTVEHRLVPVDAPPWLHLNAARTPVIAPKPRFDSLD